MDFSLFLLVLYLSRDNFLISEMTSIHVNNTTKKTPYQPQSVHSLCMLIAENVYTSMVARFQASNAVWMRSLGFYAVSIGSFLHSFRDNNCGGKILTAVLVKIQVIWDVSPCRLVNLPSSSGPAVQDEDTMFHRNVRNPSLVDTCVRMSRLTNTRSCQGELLCMTRLLRICEDHCCIHKSPILDILFIPCIMIY